MPKLVDGWVLGTHDFFLIVRVQVSLFVNIYNNRKFKYKYKKRSYYTFKFEDRIFSWIGTAIAFEAKVYWFDSDKMLKK